MWGVAPMIMERMYPGARPTGRAHREFPRISHIDGITLPAFHGGGQVHPSDRRLDNLLHVVHSQPVTGDLLAVDREIEEISGRHPFGVGASGAGDVLHGILQFLPDLFQLIEVGAQHLDPHGRPDARRPLRRPLPA